MPTIPTFSDAGHEPPIPPRRHALTTIKPAVTDNPTTMSPQPLAESFAVDLSTMTGNVQECIAQSLLIGVQLRRVARIHDTRLELLCSDLLIKPDVALLSVVDHHRIRQLRAVVTSLIQCSSWVGAAEPNQCGASIVGPVPERGDGR
jgi:hypothetical protein